MMRRPLLELRNLSKRFGDTVALDGISQTMDAGTVHAIVGENGAGKSTLASIAAGFLAPDSGEVLLDGEPLPLAHSAACRALGVAMVHQHFKLVPAFSVEENLALPQLHGLAEPARVSRRAARALALAQELGWPLDARARVGDLPVGTRQRIEVLKALAEDARVLILDEPTAALSEREVADLLGLVRDLRDRGSLVVLIAHKVREVLEVADQVTVLRAGRLVTTLAAHALNPSALADLMVGELPRWEPKPGHRSGDGVRASGLTVRRDGGSAAIQDLDLDVRCGEILGIGGVDGNGQVELAEALVGVRASEGRLEWSGPPRTVGYIPQDRRHDGLALGMSVQDNLLIEGHRHAALCLGPFFVSGRVRAWARSLMEKYEVRAESEAVGVDTLSGGNQQKVVVGRVLESHPTLLVAVNPTRGLDVRAARFVHRMLLEARDGGAAVLLVSSDLDEIGVLADRVGFLSGGRFTEGWDAASVVGGGG